MTGQEDRLGGVTLDSSMSAIC